jgi:hypothetical protein
MIAKRPDAPMGEYVGHFLKFLATFVLIIGLSLFLFRFTAGASSAGMGF